MARRHQLATRVLKYVVILESALILVMGIAVGAFGVYMDNNAEELSYITDSKAFSPFYLVMAAGTVAMAIAILGILGAFLRYTPLLAAYLLCLGGMAIAEVVISSIIFANLSDVRSRVNADLQSDIKGYVLDSDNPNYNLDNNEFIDYTQLTFECCGAYGTIDWFSLNPQYITETGGLPDTCTCTNHDPDKCYTFEYDIYTYTAWSRGCNETFATFAEQSITTTGAAIFVLGITKVVGLVTASVLFALFLHQSRHKFPYKLLRRLDEPDDELTTDL